MLNLSYLKILVTFVNLASWLGLQSNNIKRNVFNYIPPIRLITIIKIRSLPC